MKYRLSAKFNLYAIPGKNTFCTFSELLTWPPSNFWGFTGPYYFLEGLFGQIFENCLADFLLKNCKF